MSLSLLALLLGTLPAQAQYPGGGSGGGYPSGSWVPSYTYYDGRAYLVPGPRQPDFNNTYTMIPDDAAPWWFGAYGPNKYNDGAPPSEYGPPSLALDGFADNSTVDPYGIRAYFYDPPNHSMDRSDAGPLPPDLLGSVTAKSKATLSLDFVWSGPGPVPDHQNFLLRTHLGAGAWAGSAGLSATAKAKLPDQKEEVDASAGAASSSNPPALDGLHLVRVVPNGNVATVSVKGEVEADTSNSLPYATWVPGDHDFYYSGPGNGQTSASALTSIQVSASPDSRDVTISCPAIEASSYKGTPEPENPSGAYTHARASDGSLQTDSVAVWEATEKWCIQDDFDAVATNFANPTYSWTVTGLGHSMDDGTGSSTRVQALAQDGSTFPTSTSLSVTVTDSDNATATNTYGVRWHLPYESIGFLGSVRKKAQLNKLYGPVHQGDFDYVQPSPARDIDIDKGFDAAGAIAAASGQEALGGILDIIGKLAGLADFKYHYGGQDGDAVGHGTQNGQDKWTATLNNPDWAANVDTPWLLNYQDPRDHSYDGWVFCDLSIWEVKIWNHKTWMADRYTAKGYDSTGYILYADPIEKIEEEPYYTKVSGPSSPTSP